jgi:hypothetical protein
LILVLASIAVLFTIGLVTLGVAAARRSGSEADPFEWLMNLRSPSGSRFFPTDESARELVKDLEDLPDQPNEHLRS